MLWPIHRSVCISNRFSHYHYHIVWLYCTPAPACLCVVCILRKLIYCESSWHVMKPIDILFSNVEWNIHRTRTPFTTLIYLAHLSPQHIKIDLTNVIAPASITIRVIPKYLKCNEFQRNFWKRTKPDWDV